MLSRSLNTSYSTCSDWQGACSHNHLTLSVKKNKELVVDYFASNMSADKGNQSSFGTETWSQRLLGISHKPSSVLFCPVQQRRWRSFDTYWVGGERPAPPQSTRCWLKTTELDHLKLSPGGGGVALVTFVCVTNIQKYFDKLKDFSECVIHTKSKCVCERVEWKQNKYRWTSSHQVCLTSCLQKVTSLANPEKFIWTNQYRGFREVWLNRLTAAW